MTSFFFRKKLILGLKEMKLGFKFRVGRVDIVIFVLNKSSIDVGAEQ